jgi:hypothetical protein
MTTSLKTASKRRWDSKPGVKRSQFWSHSPSSATALGQLDAPAARPAGAAQMCLDGPPATC